MILAIPYIVYSQKIIYEGSSPETTLKESNPVSQVVSNETPDTASHVETNPGALENPFETKIDSPTRESLVVGMDNSKELTSSEIKNIEFGIPYKDQVYKSEEDAQSQNSFSLGKPYKIQTDLQKDARRKGY